MNSIYAFSYFFLCKSLQIQFIRIALMFVAIVVISNPLLSQAQEKMITPNNSLELRNSINIQLSLNRKIDAEHFSKFGLESEDISRLTVDDEGNIYVLANRQKLIFVFDPDWNFQNVLGKNENGELLFNNPSTISFHSDGNLYISDIPASKNNNIYNVSIIALSREGKIISSVKLNEPTFGTFVMLNSGTIVAQRSLYDMDKQLPLLYRFQPDGTFKSGFGNAKDFESDTAFNNENIYIFVNDIDDSVYLVFTFQNRIEKYDRNGELLFTMKRNLPFESKEGVYDGSILKSLSTVIARYAGVDSKNRLWVVTDISSEESIFEIYDENGVFLGNFDWVGISRRHTSVKMLINENKLFFLDPANDVIYEYEIIEKTKN